MALRAHPCGDAPVRTPVLVRSAGRADSGAAKPRPRGTGGTHANGLGELRCEWRPVGGSSSVAIVRRRARHVARAAAATDRDGLCIETPLFVLGRTVTTLGHGTGVQSGKQCGDREHDQTGRFKEQAATRRGADADGATAASVREFVRNNAATFTTQVAIMASA